MINAINYVEMYGLDIVYTDCILGVVYQRVYSRLGSWGITYRRDMLLLGIL